MAGPTRTYDHFCSLARALELVGDRWALLVVRDLLAGPRRFSDLMARLGGITPKTLSQRLRELTEAGIVEADRAVGRREVWYRLTPAGTDLAPAVSALTLWGLRHAGRPPLPGELVHPEHLLRAVRLVMAQTPPPRPLTWLFRFAGAGDYTLSFDGQDWRLDNLAGPRPPDVTVSTTIDTWAAFMTTPPDQRRIDQPGIDLRGTPREIDRFTNLLARFPDGAG